MCIRDRAEEAARRAGAGDAALLAKVNAVPGCEQLSWNDIQIASTIFAVKMCIRDRPELSGAAGHRLHPGERREMCIRDSLQQQVVAQWCDFRPVLDVGAKLEQGIVIAFAEALILSLIHIFHDSSKPLWVIGNF